MAIATVMVAAALALAARDTLAQEAKPAPAIELKLSTAVGPAFALGRAGERWGALIGERSGGAVGVKFHPGAMLSSRDPSREFLALRDGAADLAVGSTLFWSSQVSELGVVGLPWLAPEPAQLDALVAGAMRERLVAAVGKAGAVALAFAPLGHRDIATTTKPVRAPDDLAGLKVRIVSTPFLVDFYAGMGMLPQAMSLAEAQAAFRAGTLDAQEGTPAVLAATRLDSIGIRHLTLWGAIAEVAVFAVNRGVWDAWPDERRAVVRAAAEDAARELAAGSRAELDAAIAELRKRGMTIARLTATGHAAFAVAARPVYDQWAGAAGPELVRAAEDAVRAATSSPVERNPARDCGSAECSEGMRTRP